MTQPNEPEWTVDQAKADPNGFEADVIVNQTHLAVIDERREQIRERIHGIADDEYAEGRLAPPAGPYDWGYLGGGRWGTFLPEVPDDLSELNADGV